MKIATVTSCLFCTIALVFSTSAFPQQVLDTCKADVEKICKNAGHTFAEKMKCLQENESRVSYECKMAMGKVKNEAGKLEQDCADDATKFCATVPPGRGNLLKCLNSQKTHLTNSCRTALESASGK